MNSCASALEIAIKAHDIKGEVIVPSFTWVASVNAIVNNGATPVFCDIDFDYRNTTADFIEPLINSKTEAVMVVHFGGQPCDMTPIYNLCQKYNLLFFFFLHFQYQCLLIYQLIFLKDYHNEQILLHQRLYLQPMNLKHINHYA